MQIGYMRFYHMEFAPNRTYPYVVPWHISHVAHNHQMKFIYGNTAPTVPLESVLVVGDHLHNGEQGRLDADEHGKVTITADMQKALYTLITDGGERLTLQRESIHVQPGAMFSKIAAPLFDLPFPILVSAGECDKYSTPELEHLSSRNAEFAVMFMGHQPPIDNDDAHLFVLTLAAFHETVLKITDVDRRKAYAAVCESVYFHHPHCMVPVLRADAGVEVPQKQMHVKPFWYAGPSHDGTRFKQLRKGKWGMPVVVDKLCTLQLTSVARNSSETSSLVFRITLLPGLPERLPDAKVMEWSRFELITRHVPESVDMVQNLYAESAGRRRWLVDTSIGRSLVTAMDDILNEAVQMSLKENS